MEKLAYTFSLIGLICDIIGVSKLYFMKIRPIGIIFDAELNQLRFDGINRGYEAIVRAIEETNASNTILHKQSVKWFILIVLGFSFQGLSVLLFLFS